MASGLIVSSDHVSKTMKRDIIVTTSRSAGETLWREAVRWAQKLDATPVRRSGSLADLCETHDADGVLTITRQQYIYREPDSGLEYFFHPGMSKTRIHNIKAGRGDPMIAAMNLTEGDSVLDCTVGRASDAIVAAWVVGPPGRVVGLETVPIIAHLTIHGLHNYKDPNAAINSAMRRIEVRHADYEQVLPDLETGLFNVVYFDPIFHEPLARSEPMKPLRQLADSAPVTANNLQEALRVASRCVVIKQRYDTDLWEKLGITEIVGSDSSRVEYGIARPETPDAQMEANL